MILNQWTEREELELAALQDAIESLIFYCWDCFGEDEEPPTDEEAERVAKEVITVWQDRISEL